MFAHITETAEPVRPRWVAEFPAHWTHEQADRLVESVTAQLESGADVLALPDGVYLRSTEPMPWVSPTQVESVNLSAGFPWGLALSIVALLLSVAALVLALAS